MDSSQRHPVKAAQNVAGLFIETQSEHCRVSLPGQLEQALAQFLSTVFREQNEIQNPNGPPGFLLDFELHQNCGCLPHHPFAILHDPEWNIVQRSVWIFQVVPFPECGITLAWLVSISNVEKREQGLLIRQLKLFDLNLVGH